MYLFSFSGLGLFKNISKNLKTLKKRFVLVSREVSCHLEPLSLFEYDL